MSTYFWNAQTNTTIHYTSGDQISISGVSAGALQLSTGTDTLVLTNGAAALTLSAPHATLADLARLTFSFADGSTIKYGTAAGDLNGGGASDLLVGGPTSEALFGNAGNDTLVAGDMSGYMVGGSGSDTLIGNDLPNYLFGGTGFDHYVINGLQTAVYDEDGQADGMVNVDWYKTDPNVPTWHYAAGVQALPYWIDALTDGDASALAALVGPDHVVNYAFATTPASYFSADDRDGFTPFTAAQITATRTALAYISKLLNISFVETADVDGPYTIVMGNNKQTDSGGYASEIYGGHGSPLMVANTRYALHPDLYGSDAFYYVLMHEIGHSLGLKHPFAVNSIDGHGETPPFLPAAEDSDLWTVMSYTDAAEDRGMHYAPFDIAALQYIWGPAQADHPGDDVYVLDAEHANLLHDGGGANTIDGSALTAPLTLNLNPGYWSYIGSKAATIGAAGQITIDFGTLIQNATGGAGDDTLIGTDGANVLNGGAGNDHLRGGGGDDRLDGGAGIDTAVYAGARAAYTVTAAALPTSVHATVGTEGTDTLTGIERLQFSDGVLAFDTDGNAGDLFRLYQAAFDRQPDAGGLGFWVGQRDHGIDMRAIASAFTHSAEFTARYGAHPTDTAFLDLLYQNVLHRAPDAGGYDFWLGKMSGGVTAEDVLLSFSSSTENRAQVVAEIDHGILFTVA